MVSKAAVYDRACWPSRYSRFVDTEIIFIGEHPLRQRIPHSGVLHNKSGNEAFFARF